MAGKKRRVKSQDFNKQYQKAIDVFGSTVNSESRRSDSCRDDHFTLSQKTLYFTLALMCALAPTASALIQETSIGGNQSKRRARLRETTASNTLTSQTTEAIHAIDTSSSASEVTLWELLCANLAELYSVTEKTEYEEDHQPLAFMKVQSGRNAPEETVVMVSHTIGDANGVNGKTRDVQLLATDSHACGLEGYPPGICNYTGSVRTTLGLFEDNAPNGERRKALAVVKTNATHVVVAQPTKWSHSSNEAPIGIPDIMSGYQVILPPYIGYGDIPVDKYRQGTLTGPKEIPAPGCYFIQSELLQSDASCPSELKIAVSAYTQYCNTTNQPVPYSFQQGTAVIVAYGPQNQGRTTADPIFTVSGGISLVMSLLCYAQDSDTTVLAFSYYTPDGTVKVAHIPDVERLSGNIDLRLDPQTTVINVFNSNYFNIPILTRIAPLFFDESNGKYIENVLAIQYNNFTYNPKYPGKIIYGDSEGVITALKGLGSQKVKIFDIKSPPYPITTARTVFPNMFIEQFLPDVGSQRNMTALFLNTPYYEYFYNKADYNTHLNVLAREPFIEALRLAPGTITELNPGDILQTLLRIPLDSDNPDDSHFCWYMLPFMVKNEKGEVALSCQDENKGNRPILYFNDISKISQVSSIRENMSTNPTRGNTSFKQRERIAPIAGLLSEFGLWNWVEAAEVELGLDSPDEPRRPNIFDMG